MKLLAISLIVIFSLVGANAQDANDKNLAGAGYTSLENREVKAPENIVASDGNYDDFVLIRWEASEKATAYKVYRSNSEKATTLQEIGNEWQKSTWVSDYTALPNVDYFYTVVAKNDNQVSPIGNLDKGYLKKAGGKVAMEENNNLAENEVYGNGREIFLMPSEITTNKPTYQSSEIIKIIVNLQNILNQPTLQTEIRFFISKDNKLDWNDLLLNTRILSSIPAQVKFPLSENVSLPEKIVDGQYYLICVSSTEGAILSSKTISTIINIQNP